MVCLNVFWMSFITYNSILCALMIWGDEKQVGKNTYVANIIATVGDLSFVVQDWLFSE